MSDRTVQRSAGNQTESAAASWRTVLQLGLVVPAAVGLAAGCYLAGREVVANRYLAQGLWRSSLWLACRCSLLGALAGIGAGLWLLAWARGRRGSPLRMGPVLSGSLALLVVFMPSEAPDILEVPWQPVFAVAIVLAWALASAILLRRRPDADRPTDIIGGVWTALVWLGYLLALAQLWAHPIGPGWVMAGLVPASFLAVLAVQSFGRRPIESLVGAVGRRAWGPKAVPRLCMLATAVLGAGLVLWSSGWVVAIQVRGRARGRPNLILIIGDTVRADRMSLLSKPTSGWDLTPNLRQQLVPHGTVFRRAHSQAPWTLPSIASIFTGLYPEEHDAQTGASRLLPARLTLAEILREAGYRTMAVVSTPFVSSDAGMLQGFDLRDESQIPDPDAITSAEVTNRALAFLKSAQGEPFFLLAHYFDPHYPYRHHPEFGFATTGVGRFHPVKLRVAAGGISDSMQAELAALYAEEIAFTDSQIGRLLAYLDQHDLWRSTCVVFVADHGEEFRDHGSFEHGQTVYEEVVHVPLVVADPARGGPAVADDVVETRWLFGTLLDLLGVTPPVGRAATHNLFAPPQGREQYARSSNGYGGAESCLIGWPYKLIKGEHRVQMGDVGPGSDHQRGEPRPDRRAAGRGISLFDLRNDPGETRDLSGERPDLAKRLLASLETLNEKIASEARAEAMPPLSPEHSRRLHDLGYL